MNFSPKQFWKPVAVSLALAFLYAFVLTKLGRDWWSDENYSHGLLVPFVIGYIVWIEWEDLKNAPKNVSFWLGGGTILLALLMLLAGTLGAELFIQRISLVVMLGGIVIYFWGGQLLKFLVVPFLLLLFAIPIPQIIFNKIAFPLQMWASQLAIWGIRVFEVPSVRKGNVIEILPIGSVQSIALEVVEACSGIRSLMTLVTLALVLWYFTREKSRFDWVRALILMLSAIPIAIITNAGRVTSTGVLTYYYGKQSADSFSHKFSGWLVYLVALVLLMGLNFVIKKVSGRKSKVESQSFASQTPQTAHHRPIAIPLIISILVLSAFFINWFENRSEAEVSRAPLRELPSKLGNWEQRGSDTRFSEQTEAVLRTTDYIQRDYANQSGRTSNLYVGYFASQKTGVTYHSPQNCLPGAGWEMKQPELVEIITPNGNKFTANRYFVDNGRSKSVMIYWYQGRGRAVSSEYIDKVYTILDSILRQRSDGSMVRIWTPVGNSEAESLQDAVDLSAQIADALPHFVPE
ncbi:MAG: VPLPA-CTERM-specific exosortase XrtD [Pyrinomonadaceae bacterium]|nr:VPLPA-CTERM-specific exosortase XrtD [Pyrinomonadaceae bacterium]